MPTSQIQAQQEVFSVSLSHHICAGLWMRLNAKGHHQALWTGCLEDDGHEAGEHHPDLSAPPRWEQRPFQLDAHALESASTQQ